MFGFEEKNYRLVAEEGGIVKDFSFQLVWPSWFFTGRERWAWLKAIGKEPVEWEQLNLQKREWIEHAVCYKVDTH